MLHYDILHCNTDKQEVGGLFMLDIAAFTGDVFVYCLFNGIIH